MDYNSKRWKQKRDHILARDKYTDQIKLRDGQRRSANVVHHILPAEDYPEYEWCDWNLISISETTHRELHNKYSGNLSPIGRAVALEVAEAQGIKLTSVTLVVGLPGTGKSTWTAKHLGGGLCYEMDAIACAFRLTVPHMQKEHSGARRMAAAMRRAWLAEAPNYAANIFVIRTAPDYEELAETNPDKIVVCTKEHAKRQYAYDKEERKKKIANVIEWATLNNVPVEYVE